MPTKEFILVCLILLLSQSLIAQNYNSDATLIESGYISPALSAFGIGLNQGWYNTARPQKGKGLNFNLMVTNVNVPFLYYIDNTKLSTVQRLSGIGGVPENGNVPNIFGKSEAPRYKDLKTNTEFDGQKGLNQPGLVSMLQVGYGISNGTEIKARDISSLNLFGLAVMHDIKQYISSIKSSAFDVSALAGYTQFSTSSSNGTLSSKSATIQVLASKIFLKHITLFVGTGFNIATSSFDIKNYSLGQGAFIPISLNSSSNGPRATLGVRFKFSLFNFHTDFTFQKNPSITLGIGLSGRDLKSPAK